MKLKRIDLLLTAAAVAVCVGTCVVVKLTTPPFEPTAVSYRPATTAGSTTGTAVKETVLRINLNTATEEEILQVEGIGAVMAQRIVTYREQNGGFDTVDELRNVAGVGEKRWEKWQEIFYIAAE